MPKFYKLRTWRKVVLAVIRKGRILIQPKIQNEI